eukprot:TRINITY_DN11222_c2_g1_i1.p1 TRINITY_DN11222_c2_g1~~TRINITY_DN11222_c2_g1_i1.p1  ORF type:complete len:315 (+),score=59.74 TRINITY_DN11222_c2_g1_i1:62-1006(+)
MSSSSTLSVVDSSDCAAYSSSGASDHGAPATQGAPPLRRWCNKMYRSTCSRCQGASDEPCPYIHIDTYVVLPTEDRLAMGMPNLMTRHMKLLTKEMLHIVNGLAQRVLDDHAAACVWAGPRQQRVPSAYGEVVAALRGLGWVIPPAGPPTSLRREHAPYAQDVANILALAASSLHYNVTSSVEIMFKTVSWVLARQGEAPRVGLQEKTRAVPVDVYVDDLPPLMDSSLSDDDESSFEDHDITTPCHNGHYAAHPTQPAAAQLMSHTNPYMQLVMQPSPMQASPMYVQLTPQFAPVSGGMLPQMVLVPSGVAMMF